MAGKVGRAIYSDRRWKHVRRICLERAGWQCEECGRNGRLEVHHKIPCRDEKSDTFFDSNNLAVLCRICHVERHNQRQVGRQEADWRLLVLSTGEQ